MNQPVYPHNTSRVALTWRMRREKSPASAILPLLWRRWAIKSLSHRASELIDDGFFWVKALISALRLYSSSTRCFCRRRRKNTAAPIIAARATTPTTTPAAMPAVLVPPPDDFAVAEASLDAVTTIVCPA